MQAARSTKEMAGLSPAVSPLWYEKLLTLFGVSRRSEAEETRQASEAQALRRVASFSIIATGNTK